MTVVERSIPGFLPTTAGFHFANRWPPSPTLRFAAGSPDPCHSSSSCGSVTRPTACAGGWLWRHATAGCGASRRRRTAEPPAEGSALFRELRPAPDRQPRARCDGRPVLSSRCQHRPQPGTDRRPRDMAGGPPRDRRGAAGGLRPGPRRERGSAAADREPPGPGLRVHARLGGRAGQPSDLRPEPSRR